jgi:ABC-type transport system involved in multi-copper enzyme maturation permease subunit
MSLGRILAIAINVVKEVFREQVLYLSLLYVFVLVAAITLLPALAANTHEKITIDIGVAAIEVVGLIVAVFVSTGLVNREIDKRTIFVLVAKPLSRAEFILGKHLGVSIVLATLVAVMSVIFVLFMLIAGIDIPTGSILVANFFTFWKLMLVGAIAILFSTFTSALLAALLTFAAYLMGNISADILKLGEIADSPAVQKITQLIYLVLPDLSRANLKNDAVFTYLPSIGEMFNNGVYILAYACIMLALAMLIFARRQF